jgi:asparagine synthase (glutamine-hydrolysing)
MVTRHLRWMSAVDMPDLERAIPAAKGMVPATLTTALPETDDSLQRMLALDFSTYMPGSVLAKVDRASMAHGLEVRPPLLDDALIARSFALPSRYKVRRGSGKFLLKLAARGKIPDEIIDRPKKGFGIPLQTWLRGPLKDRIHQVVTSSPVFGRGGGILDGDVFRGWNDAHQAKKADHSKPLWALLVLDHWFRRH